MRIDILTVVPELLESPLSHSIVGRAIKKRLVEIHVQNIRKYGLGPRATVDDYCYGGDAGMVMMIEPVERMIEELKAEREYDEVIYMSPDGERLDQGISNELSLKKNLILLCGHYKGIDHGSGNILSPVRSRSGTMWSAAARSRRHFWRTRSSG